MTLHILHWLADGYGSTRGSRTSSTPARSGSSSWSTPTAPSTTSPGGTFHHWRKNRQPTPGTTAIGTDLNRNYSYRWGGGGRTSANPLAITYRGPDAFSTPEDRAMRDFMASRVVDGRQQIRAAITFHEYGRLVMWPYGYTKTDVPSDMTAQDHAALVVIGRTWPRTNGYKAEQASDLYVSSGTSRDYQYGVYRIFAYTIELSVRDYPDDSLIAVRDRTQQGGRAVPDGARLVPAGVLGATVRTARCGAFDDDLEVYRGWTVNPDGTDTAPPAARFARANPAGTPATARSSSARRPSGSKAFVTGAAAGSSSTANDLDGRTTIRSPAIALAGDERPAADLRLRVRPQRGSTSADSLRAIVERADGSQVEVFRVSGRPADVDGAWQTASISMDAFAGQTVHLRFVATDGGPANLVEVELDDVRVTRAD